MKNVKYIILSILGLLPAVAAFFSMLFYNTLYAAIGDKATVLYWLFPAISIIFLGILIFVLFYKKDNKFAIPIFSVLISIILAFVLISDASTNKIHSDFLSNELAFNSAIKQLKQEHYIISGDDYKINAGTYEIQDEALFSAVPTKQVMLTKIGEKHSAFLFITIDNAKRTEGYAYVPDGTPLDWDPAFIEWSDALDIDGNWYYICIYK